MAAGNSNESKMNTNPTVPEQVAFYDSWNSKYRGVAFDEISDEIRVRGERVLQILRTLNLESPNILEIGCGTGWLSEKLCQFGKVTAIDLSPKAIDIARQRTAAADFIAGDFYEHTFCTNPFDVLVCVETLFYVADQPRFLRKMASLVPTGKYVVITSINKFVYERSIDVGAPAQGQIREWLSPGQMRRLVSEQFEVLSMNSIEPRGNRGVLRIINSRKVNAVLNGIFTPKVVKRMKEKLGLGGGIVLLGRKKT